MRQGRAYPWTALCNKGTSLSPCSWHLGIAFPHSVWGYIGFCSEALFSGETWTFLYHTIKSYLSFLFLHLFLKSWISIFWILFCITLQNLIWAFYFCWFSLSLLWGWWERCRGYWLRAAGPGREFWLPHAVSTDANGHGWAGGWACLLAGGHRRLTPPLLSDSPWS